MFQFLEDLKQILSEINISVNHKKITSYENWLSNFEPKSEEPETLIQTISEEEIHKLMKDDLENNQYREFNFHANSYNHTSIRIGNKSRRVIYVCVTVGEYRSGVMHYCNVIEDEEKMWKILENYDEEGFAYITMNSPNIDELKRYVHSDEWEKIKTTINKGYTRRLFLK